MEEQLIIEKKLRKTHEDIMEEAIMLDMRF